MVYSSKKDAKEEEFQDLLEETRQRLLPVLKEQKKAVSYTGFETVVYEYMVKAAVGTSFEGTINQTKTYDFPDIVANGYYGVEVKYTKEDKWKSTGNSVLETNRVDDIQRVYFFFGKFGGEVDIRYRLYQECLTEVSVTHSPRYRVDMDLAKGETIFDKIEVDYDELRRYKDPIKPIKDYYRAQLKEGEELWWIDQNDVDKSVSPIIRPFRNLSKQERLNFTAECFVLFPEMFGKSITKFERAAAYLIAEYNAVSSNLRDTFTAGGREEIKIENARVRLPRIYSKLKEDAVLIEERLKKLDKQILRYYWREDKIQKDRLKQWKSLLDQAVDPDTVGTKPSKVFDIGYAEKKNT